MSKLSIRDLDLKGKRVFIRVDFNVPLAAGGQEITSDKRIKASLPTIRYALEQGAGLILASHLGRPKGKPNPEMSLKPAAKRLEELLGKPVKMAPDCIGPQVEAMLPKPGEVLLLENLRFHPEEEKNDPEFSRKLAAFCDLYVNDAFGSAHRAHASTAGMIAFVPQAAAGLLMEQELRYLTLATTNPPRPCVAILGGAKVSDKIEVISNLGKVVDKLLIGGAMAYTFLSPRASPWDGHWWKTTSWTWPRACSISSAASCCCRWITSWSPRSRKAGQTKSWKISPTAKSAWISALAP